MPCPRVEKLLVGHGVFHSAGGAEGPQERCLSHSLAFLFNKTLKVDLNSLNS